MRFIDEPCAANGFHGQHIRRLRQSLLRYAGRDLVDDPADDVEAARSVFEAPFALVSHDTQADPMFNYANRAALDLFEMGWQELNGLPSRLSAEPVHRDERARLMQRVADEGVIDDYAGVRISKTGRRFLIRGATVWNLGDDEGRPYGQAAMFDDWEDVT